MGELIATFERACPGASNKITASGPQVPVAFRMDDTQLRSTIGPISKTSLMEGVDRTLNIFRRLRAEGRLV